MSATLITLLSWAAAEPDARKNVATSKNSNPTELGEDMRWALLAVPSRDGSAVIAAGRAGEGTRFTATTNTLFTCLHTDNTVEVPAGGQKTTRQLLYFIKGDLTALLERFRDDFGL